MKPTKVINQPKPAPLPTAQGTSFPACGLAITQENTYQYETIFHFDAVPNAIDYAGFSDYSDPNMIRFAWYDPAKPNQVRVTFITCPYQNQQYSFDLVAYTATSVICVQRVTFTTHYLT